jgi:TetR/AcrR family transcriptional repressor of nem operon
MRYSKSQKEQTRRRILDEAKRLFRESGAESIGIGELMAKLGLTHGGFYAHFKSKDALVAEACFEIFLDTSAVMLARAQDQPPHKRLEACLDYYLDECHRDQPDQGCAMPTMAAEVARSSGEVRQAFTHGFKAWLEKLEPAWPGQSGRPYERGPVLAMVSSMVGAVLLSRAVDDKALSGRLLRETAEFIKASTASE